MPLKGVKSVRQAISKADEPYNKKLKGVFLQGLGNISAGTPVDEGRAAGNWFLKVGNPSTETTSSTNGGDDLDKMPQWVLGKKLFYANNMPYINMLEYGGYDDGAKTRLGYSDQAVGGWVRKELLIMRKGIRNI